MYLTGTYLDEAAKRVASDPRPFGPDKDLAVVAQTVKVEVWATNFTDPGSDFVEFRGFAAGVDKPLWTARVEGY